MSWRFREPPGMFMPFLNSNVVHVLSLQCPASAGTRHELRALRSSAAQSSEERRANKRLLVGVRAHRTVSAGAL